MDDDIPKFLDACEIPMYQAHQALQVTFELPLQATYVETALQQLPQTVALVSHQVPVRIVQNQQGTTRQNLFLTVTALSTERNAEKKFHEWQERIQKRLGSLVIETKEVYLLTPVQPTLPSSAEQLLLPLVEKGVSGE